MSDSDLLAGLLTGMIDEALSKYRYTGVVRADELRDLLLDMRRACSIGSSRP